MCEAKMRKYWKKGKKGYVNWICRICGKAEGSIEYIWECETGRDQIKEQWVRGVDDWRADRRRNELALELLETLMKGEKMELCEYLRAFENLAYLREPSLVVNGEPERDEVQDEI